MSEQAQQSKSKKDDWKTPERVLRGVQMDGIDLDPCPGDETDIGEVNYYQRDGFDGLNDPWKGIVYCNPPFSEDTDWLEKAVEESQRDQVVRVYFVTADKTDVGESWHQFVAPHAQFTCFFKYRIKYIDPKTGEQAGNPSFGTALHVFGSTPPVEVLRWMDNEGDLVTRGIF